MRYYVAQYEDGSIVADGYEVKAVAAAAIRATRDSREPVGLTEVTDNGKKRVVGFFAIRPGKHIWVDFSKGR